MASNGSITLDFGSLDWRAKKAPVSKWTCKIGNSTIEFQKQPLIVVVLLSGFLLLTYFKFSGGSLKSPEPLGFHQQNSIYNSTYPLTRPVITPHGMRYRIAVIADLDTDSKVEDKANTWRSYLKFGFITWNEKTGFVGIDWDRSDPEEIKSSLSIGGRGMELSELSVFNGYLYSVDDRTGVVYRLNQDQKGRWKVIPWVILADGNGEETKGFKCEWMAVKGQHLYVGGLGKEWTTQDGTVLNFNPMFVKKISANGHVQHLDWYDNYVKLRSRAGIEFPGYMIHEAAMWSNHHEKWTFLPRRASKLKYNDVEDERHGTNMMLSTDDSFNKIDLTEVGDLSQPSHGFSSFKFIPDTNDDVIVALKSEELAGKIASYIMVFRRDGSILYPETYIGDHKYEGIEFI